MLTLIEEALKLRRTKDAIFIVYEQTIYGDDVDSDEWMHGIFSSYAAAEACIKKDIEEKKDEEDQMSWYEINLWTKGDSDSYVNTCTYYYIDGGLVYTEVELGVMIFMRVVQMENYEFQYRISREIF